MHSAQEKTPEKFYNLVQCALGNDGHILQCAIALNCGHFICKKCIPIHFVEFRCPKCNFLNSNNLSKNPESQIVDFHINTHIDKLSNIICEKIVIEKSISENPRELLQSFYETKLNFIRENIDIRTESLIQELLTMRSESFDKIEKIKLNLINISAKSESYVPLTYGLIIGTANSGESEIRGNQDDGEDGEKSEDGENSEDSEKNLIDHEAVPFIQI